MSFRTPFVALLIALPAAAAAQQDPAPPIPAHKDPGTATLYSLALPGAGQIYAGETGRGLIILGGSTAAMIVGAALSSEASCRFDQSTSSGFSCNEANRTPLTVATLAALGAWGYGVWDARRSAERQNARRAASGRTAARVEPVVLAVNPRTVGMGMHATF